MSKVYYVAVLEKETDSGIGVFFPDIPGLVAGGENQEDALRNAEESLQFHLDSLIEQGLPLPEPGDLQSLKEERGGACLAIALIPATLHGRRRRIQLTLDEKLVDEIDAWAVAAGYTRSGFFAEAARRMMRDG